MIIDHVLDVFGMVENHVSMYIGRPCIDKIPIDSTFGFSGIPHMDLQIRMVGSTADGNINDRNMAVLLTDLNLKK